MSTKKKKNFFSDLLERRGGLIAILLAIVFIGATLGVFYYYARKGVKEEVDLRAKSELLETSLKVEGIFETVEVALDNMAWVIEESIDDPDHLYGLLEPVVIKNKNILGIAVGYVANYFPEKGRWFEPYVSKDSLGTISRRQLGSATHDYLNMQWFKEPVEQDSALWSEPYFDEEGAKELVVSYTVPLRNKGGKVVGVIIADLSLDWLSKFINGSHLDSENLIVSNTGSIILCPVESLVLKHNIVDLGKRSKDTAIMSLNNRLLAGETGETAVKNKEGDMVHVYYSPVNKRAGWSMAVIHKDYEMFKKLHKLSQNLGLFLLSGLILLLLILWRTAHQSNSLLRINAEKERIGSELHIANSIQQSMIPKDFPPFPDRDDIDVVGLLKPAREVGGDLFDFYIRDEKLFFCIADVSGKGVPASLVMAVTRTEFRTVTAHEASAVRIMELMNEQMSAMNNSMMFVTLFLGVLDLPTGRLRYCNAGHNAPLIIGGANEDGESIDKNEKSVQFLPVVSNIPLGLVANFKFEGQEMVINPQTKIFLYTDGLTEAEDIDHKQFGEKRMEAVAQAWYEAREKGNADTQGLVSSMNSAVSKFVGEAEQSDDLTILVVDYTKKVRDVRLKRSLTLPNDVQTIPQLSEFVEGVAEELGFDMDETMNLNLAMEEAVVNVMNYAYPKGTEGDVLIDAEANDLRLKFTITDYGSPFDPTAKEDVDTSLAAEDRPIGGLGIYLVRQLMDSMNYERVEGRNVLTLRKRLEKEVKES
ncbi:MAG: SpoIIE family protein phosphatase [Prevotella sp.]|nr:SpoIIE family protein phosphatase [Prevotella sp.]